MVEGEPACVSSEKELEALCETLYNDSLKVVKAAALYIIQEEEQGERDEPPAPLELSLVLCDDAHIQELNKEWRGVDAPTDVLSFELEDAEAEAEDDDDYEEGGSPQLPINVLGDVVISLDTAARQAAERQYTMLDEARVLLVHGVLHLLGFDHEEDEEEAAEMAAAEQHILKSLGWKGQGLINLAGRGDDVHGDEGGSGGGGGGGSGDGGSRGFALHSPDSGASTSAPAAGSAAAADAAAEEAGAFIKRWRTRTEAQLLALDMDGTLLDSSSRVLPSSVAAIQAALARGITVFLATGKARPAAIRAMQAVGLAGEGMVVSQTGPGIFLQGLTAYGRGGRLIAGGTLPADVVRAAFEFSAAHDVPVCGFLGEQCVTNKLHPELEELHHRYYEPLAAVTPLAEVLAGPPLRKLLFMTSPAKVEGHLKPHWEAALAGSDAETMQAVPDMLELVPSGWDKWRAVEHLLEDLGVPASDLVAIGDGGNDLGLVSGAGVGVAMGNAVPAVRAAARLVVADNDSGGVAEAIERLLL
ncbi:Haloacid dehalogenase-like hydrolase family isoform 2 [Micractinium conductrix]|uniref:Haloacid dehalogenase-like hydrolase family isoform 2 n=1 Tax=Micractinium conductrix TaxID=554055 RepID=A0A2P6V406_9CHLO|nr:Haloacid dehalogenase-like hydrolase family isoform 2 [Micractinium conductrix]|eukprot:PSC68822.1 Haloacid dehalogenase-like hydrolase family isoform 2 [Micractinium conductrix]